MYLIISEADRYIKEKNGNKHLVFDLANENNENNEVLRKYNQLWDGIKYETETMNGGKTSKHSSVFEELGKFHPQVNLDESLYEL